MCMLHMLGRLEASMRSSWYQNCLKQHLFCSITDVVNKLGCVTYAVNKGPLFRDRLGYTSLLWAYIPIPELQIEIVEDCELAMWKTRETTTHTFIIRSAFVRGNVSWLEICH
jgi:hypothetical protein